MKTEEKAAPESGLDPDLERAYLKYLYECTKVTQDSVHVHADLTQQVLIQIKQNAKKTGFIAGALGAALIIAVAAISDLIATAKANLEERKAEKKGKAR